MDRSIMKIYQQYFLANVILFCVFMFIHLINSHVPAEMPAILVRPLATLFSTCVGKHLVSDKALHIYKHLQSSGTRHDSSSTESFTILDSATSSVQVKIKEALYIKWEFPTPNQKLRHLDLSLSF